MVKPVDLYRAELTAVTSVVVVVALLLSGGH